MLLKKTFGSNKYSHIKGVDKPEISPYTAPNFYGSDAIQYIVLPKEVPQ